MKTKKMRLAGFVLVLLSVILGAVISVPPAHAQWQGVAAAVAAPVIQKGISEIQRGIFSMFECCPVRVCGGRTWWVFYQDGTITQNETRKCRDYDDIYAAVVYGHGDCDWRDQNGREVCYKNVWDAQKMLRAHGEIIDIQHE